MMHDLINDYPIENLETLITHFYMFLFYTNDGERLPKLRKFPTWIHENQSFHYSLFIIEIRSQ